MLLRWYVGCREDILLLIEVMDSSLTAGCLEDREANQFGRISTFVRDFRLSMPTLSSATTYFGLGLGALCAVTGLVLHGIEGGLLGGLVGYFLGKTIQSIFRTLFGDYTT